MSLQATHLLDHASAPPAEAPASGDAARAGFARRAGSQMTRELDGKEQVRAGLVELGVPGGLANVLAEEDQRIGMRIYLLDNSGSMNNCDGSMLTKLSDGRVQQRTCTRWEEICSFAQEHARWNLATGIPAEFMLLNSANAGGQPQDGIDFVRVERGKDNSTDALTKLLRNNPPRGATPITKRLMEIGTMVQAQAPELAKKGQMIFLTLATDGLPSDSRGGVDQDNMIREIKRLTNSLPVQMVIRLCTDESHVVEFYNRVDEEYELPLDIIDDFESEAKEIAGMGNDFFTYTTVLHQVREAGTLCKLMDSIDEQRLTPLEVRRFVELLSDESTLQHCPDNKAFVAQVRELVSQKPQVYDPVTGQMRPYLNMRSVQRSLGVGFCINFLPCF